MRSGWISKEAKELESRENGKLTDPGYTVEDMEVRRLGGSRVGE